MGGFRGIPFDSGEITITPGTVTLITRNLNGAASNICAEIINKVGGDALVEFSLQLQDCEGGEWYDFLVGADWADAGNLNRLFASEDPHTLAADHTSHIHARINYPHAIRFQANVGAGDEATLRVCGTVGGA